MSNFERQKNTKAAAYSILLIGALVMLFFVISWTPPSTPLIPVEEGMEVNLGDSETGEGEIQPLLPGQPAQEELLTTTVPPPPSATDQSEEKEIETNDNDKEAPPAIVKKPTAKPKEKPPVNPVLSKTANVKSNSNTISNSKPTTPSTQPPTPTPTSAPAPTPKYVLKAQNGAQGGNNASTSQSSTGQGISGGKGDQGKPTGDPNSDSYSGTGGSGNGGVAVSRGLQGRKINRFPSFQDDFNENAKVAVDIKVDTKGNVVGTAIQPRGTTTVNATLKSIALQKAKLLKFSPDEDGAEEQLGTIVFDFRVRN